ncbi:MAG: NusA-like transcription termination signal-binding factor [Candidatus Altiarchaeales archaeon]|nr:MAG: NusA-like transcription termination signal-binding factor [Candidatus Altiarchaeales archaeon]
MRLSNEEIKYITLFETLTGATVKDCIRMQNVMAFLIKKGNMGLAIGRNGSNIEKVRKVTGKSIIVMEFSDNIEKFIENLFHPVKIKEVVIKKEGNGKVADIKVRKLDRKKIIGHNGMRIKIAKKLAKRHYNIDNINVKVF